MAFLSDIKVLDMTYGLAGPMATQVLVDFGAQIVRVDKPHATRTPNELVRLRGRRSIAIDLDSDGKWALLDRLLGATDVVLTEPAIDGVDPLDVVYATLAARFPRLIWCRITGYGDEGPLVEGPTDDHLIAARYGIYDQPGYRDGPTYVTGHIPSMAAGLLAAQAIGTALFQREKTGKGMEVSTSLLAGALSFLPTIVTASIDPPGGNAPMPPRRPAGSAPYYSIYECADGRYLHFGCLTPAFRTNATRAVGLVDELAALGFETPAARPHTGHIIDLIAAKMAQRTFDDWAEIFEAQDVPYAEAQWTEDMLDNEQILHEKLVLKLDDPVVGPMSQMGPVAIVDGIETPAPSPAPIAGQHTDEVCRELGFTDAHIASLRNRGVLA